MSLEDSIGDQLQLTHHKASSAWPDWFHGSNAPPPLPLKPCSRVYLVGGREAAQKAVRVSREELPVSYQLSLEKDVEGKALGNPSTESVVAAAVLCFRRAIYVVTSSETLVFSDGQCQGPPLVVGFDEKHQCFVSAVYDANAVAPRPPPPPFRPPSLGFLTPRPPPLSLL